MKKQLLLKLTDELMDRYRKSSYEIKIFITIRKSFKEYLENNSQDTEVWLAYALVMNSLAEGEDYSVNCLWSILTYDPSNINATMLLVYILAHNSYVDDDLFKQLCNLRTEDKEVLSMIEYEKIWYYTSDLLYEKVLLNSIELCDTHVYNFVKLGNFYIRRGYIAKGRDFLKKGLDNVKLIYDNHSYQNILNVEEYFNEQLKGIHLTDSNYKIILESFDPKSPWITGDFISKREPFSEN